MVDFKECYITLDNKYLVIDVSIPDSLNTTSISGTTTSISLSGVYISLIAFEGGSTYTDTGMSDKSVTVYSDTDTSTGATHKRSYRTVIDIADTTLSKDLVFITVKVAGNIPTTLPCSFKGTVKTTVIYNPALLYNTGIKHIKSLNSCTIDTSFIDYILNTRALDLSIFTGHYTEAKAIWKRLFNTKTITNKTCNCYGLN